MGRPFPLAPTVPLQAVTLPLSDPAAIAAVTAAHARFCAAQVRFFY